MWATTRRAAQIYLLILKDEEKNRIAFCAFKAQIIYEAMHITLIAATKTRAYVTGDHGGKFDFKPVGSIIIVITVRPSRINWSQGIDWITRRNTAILR